MPYEGLDPFIDEEDLSTYLGRDVTAEDLAWSAAVAACNMIRNAADQSFALVEDEEVLIDGSGTDTILLPELPVSDVTEVYDADDELLDPDEDYLVDKKRGALVRRSRTGVWTEGRGNYVVTYSHGYSAVPEDLRVLAMTVAARLYDQGLAKQESTGGHSITFASDDPVGLTRREKESVVAKYRPVRSASTYDA
jgi:hypothetical protein